MEEGICTLIDPMSIYFYWHFFLSHSNCCLQISRKSSTKADSWKVRAVLQGFWKSGPEQQPVSDEHPMEDVVSRAPIIHCFWHWFSGLHHLLPFMVWRTRQMRSREGAGFISMKLFEEKVMEQHINILRGQSLLSRSFSSTAHFISLNHFTWCIYYCFSLARIFPACVLGAFYICLECKFDYFRRKSLQVKLGLYRNIFVKNAFLLQESKIQLHSDKGGFLFQL